MLSRFEQSSLAEAADAMNWLAAERQCERFVLVGLCSGTLTAFRAAEADPRVAGVVLLTALLQDPSTVPPDVVAEASDRRIARSYLVEKAGRGRTWRRLVSGQVNVRHALETLRRLLRARRQSRPADAGTVDLLARMERVLDRGVSVLFIFAEPTTVLEYFRMTLQPRVPDLRRHGRIHVEVLTGADHTFTELRHQIRVLDVVSGWLATCT